MDVQAHHLGLKLSPLDFAPLLYGLITGLILYLPLVALYNLTLHPLARARIPLYSVGSVASSWPATVSMLLKGKRHVEVHERQPLVGPVMRTGANEVVLSDPAWNRFIMGSKFSKGLVTNHHEVSRRDGRAAKLFFNHDHHVAAGKRKAILPHYAAHQMPQWNPEYQEHFGKLLRLINAVSSTKAGEGIDIMPIFRLTCIDIGGQIVMGTELGMMDAYLQGRDRGMGEQTRIAFYRSLCASSLPSLVWSMLEWLPVASWQTIVQSERVLQNYYTPLIRAAMNKPMGDRPCTAQRLRATVDHHTRLPWTEHHIIEECMDHIMVSPEPTGVAAYALWLLSTHPRVQEKLADEVRAHRLERGEVAGVREVAEYEYLLAVLKETIRLYPAAPGPRLRVLGKEGMMVGEYHIPAGTAVGVQVWTAHRSVGIWGSDAACFRPERFLEEMTPEQTVAFSPFSSGNRPCPGQNFASATLRVSVSSIVRSFHLRPAPETTVQSMEPRDWATLIPASGECKLIFTPREA